MSDLPSGYVTTRQATKLLNVKPSTLTRWANTNRIDFIKPPGKYTHRLYNVKKFIEENSSFEKVREDKINICYCRVSTRKQKDDLNRQVEFMRERYPSYTIITDIGSGLNFKRKGLQQIIDYAIEGKVEKVVVAYKDRLCRFGFELIERIVSEYSKGEIVVLKQIKLSPEKEMVTDVLTILNVFSARLNGLRKYKVEISEDKSITNYETEGEL